MAGVKRQIIVRVDEATKERWAALAAAEGCSLNTLIMRGVESMAAVGAQATPEAAVRAVRRPARQRCSDPRGSHAKAKAQGGWLWCPECAAKVNG